jgi:DNA helicase-2/ATP-dependent DNA helicase PcrA
MSFATRYTKLNTQQKRAVDTIDGPVMVVAGPGTGKTELLSMRAANILTKTDTLPESILCLTFTESGAHAMRERLASIIGKDAYKVAIHTFHSFGSEIINQYGEYFYQGAHFRPADELSTHKIITDILDGLEYTNPLAGKMNGEYTHLRDCISAISDLKRSGLTSDELLQIIDTNETALDEVEPDLAELFSRRISSSTLAQLIPIAHKIAALETPVLPNGITPLASTLALSLAHAVDAATEENSTKPVTAWKNKWLTKSSDGRAIFKDRSRHKKLRAVSYVYFQYLTRMQEAGLYDYDDMILRVVHALEVFDDLRFNLQERYQYIMVDEFQDTNLAQMRIIASLTNNPAQGDTPNVMVVGDDDQAIYSFQGADISNILSFRSLYPKAQLILLIDNYRSGEAVLTTARALITQGADRLERHIEELDKTLTAHTLRPASVSLHEAPTVTDEHQWLVQSIQQKIDAGTAPDSIVVLTRRHSEIIELLPHFAHAKLPVSYERRDNVFELEPIKVLLQTAQVITLFAEQRLDEADRMLPELLAHPAWGITPQDLWKLSLQAYDARTRWIDTMATISSLQPLHQLLTELTVLSHTQSLEPMLDTLLGTPPHLNEATPISPLYNYFFSPEKLTEDSTLYLRYLEGLRTIRAALRDHHTDQLPTLKLFVQFSHLYQQTGSTLTSVHQPSTTTPGNVQLMTAHKSKGLEFDTVYIPGAVDSMWGERVRSRSRLINYPENLPLATVGDSPDERLRLFYVAVTRAKRELHMSYSLQSVTGKMLDRASFLTSLEITPEIITPSTLASPEAQAELRWYTTLTEPKQEIATLLAPQLETYKLSATHLGNFLDVTRGGPQGFLIHTLLRFPQAMSPSAAYGSAVHATLQRAHAHLAATGKQRAIEDVLHDYEAELSQHRLNEHDIETYTQKGIDALQAFLAARYDSFTREQKVELNFAGQQSIVDGAHLTGKLDLVDIDTSQRTMTVTDYKTGKPSQAWKGATDYEKIKLHRYRQQLMFYKLLVEHSRDYGNYEVNRGVLQFVEPTKSGEILSLDDDFSHNELDDFRRLVVIV